MTILVPQHKFQYTRELITVKDGSQVALDWGGEEAVHLSADSPILVVCHGLSSCSDAMRSMCHDALHAGFRPVAFNQRGHGGTKLLHPKLQPFGDISDLDQAIQFIHQRFPNAPIVGVGFSAGSGLMVSYLGEKGKESLIKAAVAVSPGTTPMPHFAKLCRIRCIQIVLQSGHDTAVQQSIDTWDSH